MLIQTDSEYDRAMSRIREADEIAFDLETTGLDIFKGDRLCGVSVLVGEDGYYFPFRHGEGHNLPLSWLNPLLVNCLGRTLVTWNGKFDIKFVMAELGKVVFPPVLQDVMLAAHLMNENEPSFKLKDIGAKYIDRGAKDEEQELAAELKIRGLKKGQMSRLPATLVEPYAVQDVVLTARLKEFYLPRLDAWRLGRLWDETNDYLKVITKMEMRGIQIDLDMCRSRIEEAKVEYIRSYEKIKDIVGYYVNPNSPKQVAGVLGLPSTAADVLETSSNPIAALILDCRRWSKVSGAYYEKFLAAVDGTGVIHPNLNQIGTVTSRLSCDNPNMQAIPRKEDKTFHPKSYVKSVFVARPGHYLVQADYKQAEVFLGAHYAQAVSLIDMLRRNVDVHTETALQLDMPRPLAKRLNFAMQYGIGPAALQADIKAMAKLDISLDEAKAYLTKYNTLHPEMKAMYKRLETSAKANGYVRLITGRCRRYNGLEYPTATAKPSPYHKASSNLIQGGVAEIMRVASTAIDRNVSVVNQLLHVHDSIIAEIPVDQFDKGIQEMVHWMTNPPDIELTVPLRVDVEYGTRWIDLQPLSKETA